MINISIIIAAYNAEKYIKSTLKSVLEQNFFNYEIIVVDDCSKDNTLKILNNFKRKNDKIRVFRNLYNIGAGPSRNIAIKKAFGEYIFILDSDDKLCNKSVLAKLYNFAKKMNSDVVQFEYKIFNEQTKKIALNKNILKIKNGKVDLSKCTLASNCRLYRRKYLSNKDIEYGQGNYAEDHLFVIKSLVETDRLSYFSEPCYCYTERLGSLTNNVISANTNFNIVTKKEPNNLEYFFNNVKRTQLYLTNYKEYKFFSDEYLLRSLKAKFITLSDYEKDLFILGVENIFSKAVAKKILRNNHKTLKWIFSITKYKDSVSLVKTKVLTVFGKSFILNKF